MPYSANLKAFLDMVAWSEGTTRMPGSDDGYNVLVGSTTSYPSFFSSYADHPRVKVWLASLGVYSTAAGRYQLLERYFDVYKVQLGLPDFSAASQDAIAVQQMTERHAVQMVEAGNIGGAIQACSSIWASLPGNDYGQHQNAVDDLMAQYQAAGGATA